LGAVTCFQGVVGSTARCSATPDPTRATFAATDALEPGAGLTIVVSIEKGAVSVAPPKLEPLNNSSLDQFKDFMGRNRLVYAATILVAAGAIVLLVRLWWIWGRDHWLGDNYYLSDRDIPDRVRPIFAHQTIVPEYGP